MFTLAFVKEKLDFLVTQFAESALVIEAVTGNEEKLHLNVKIGVGPGNLVNKGDIEALAIAKMKQEGANTVGILFKELEENAPVVEETLINTRKPPIFWGIASGKGGVGKSTVTVNLAVALAGLGKKVGIIDADIYGPSIPHMMGVTALPQQVNEKFEPPVAHGVKVMSMEFFKKDDQPVMWRGPMLGRMLDVFLVQTRWGELDYVLFDLPPGTGDIAIDLNTHVPTIKEIIVTTPHGTAAHIAKNAGKMGAYFKHEILGVVENMAYLLMPDGSKQQVFGEGGGEALAKELGVTVLGQVPMGQPADGGSIYEAGSAVASVFEEIVKQLVQA